jgi:hypothetical protein
MKNIANLLFEANMLKEIPRSGFHFLGSGHESVAEHSFSTTFIAFVMSKLETKADALKLISMCLVHDLAESRIGDLNAVQKNYVSADETKMDKPSISRLADGCWYSSSSAFWCRELTIGATVVVSLVVSFWVIFWVITKEPGRIFSTRASLACVLY